MKHVYGVLLVAVAGGLCGSAAHAASPPTVDVLLNFWTPRDTGELEPVGLLLPRTGDECPSGFAAAGELWCGRQVFVSVALYEAGQEYNSGSKQILRYRKSSSGYWQPYITVLASPMLRSVTVEPFADIHGLRYSVQGVVWLRMDERGAYSAARRVPEHPFLVETVDNLPSVRHLECRHASTHAEM